MKVEEIQQLLSLLKLELVWSLTVGAIAFFCFLMIKDFLTTLVFYHQFRSNDYVSIGTMVSVNGFVGRIQTFTITYIVVEGESGYYRVPMKDWQRQKWIFLRTEWRSDTKLAGRRLGLRHDDDIKIDRDLFTKVTATIKHFEEEKQKNVDSTD